ncbi:recombinase family protein [Apilactobacillus micheneri]|uniref:Recombinase family protein n=1 Tax=Apilactobacillus micheneri TaxID=1899430 RepID=A0ABY2YYF8_9LACO|nr:recombinase family protein [Apilactobacillus micheneri]TPR26248.1 recombinase family protein [Apilactobacillus micheneri]TPR27002.1 recombinase family protein [Apilactobacillus micheneri]TPR27860.1 recombinase family protein [Apilactobacillus micheneri]TPR31765.1 recombinase family protein [Apilactobacillus micheneri]TPR32169.1 recombinase family protein [Apilactobacillus micheneri]
MNVKHAVGYIRVSTSSQAIDGYSLEAQKNKIQNYCKTNNLILDKIYSDEGISGSSIAKRPGIQELIYDAKQKMFDTVVVWKNSRIARNTRDLLSMVDVFQKHGISFASVSEKIDLDSAQGRFMFTIMGTVSELERNNIAENVYLGMYKRAQDGYATVGRVLGYKPGIDNNGKKQLQIDNDEAVIIKIIFNKFISGSGFRSIANYLNKNQYHTKLGNAFSSGAVKDIIDNPLYVGMVRYSRYRNWNKKRRNGINDSNMIMIQGNHNPIISKDIWKKAVIRRNVTTIQPAWNNQGTNLLTGILKCPQCGSPMAASNTTNTLKDGTKKRIRYYSCSQFRNKGSEVCHANSIQSSKAEKLVMDKFNFVIKNKFVLNKINQDNGESQIKNRNKRIIQNKQSQIDKNNQLIYKYKQVGSTDSFLSSTLQPRILELEAENKQLNNNIKIINSKNNKISLTSKDIGKIKLLFKDVVCCNNRKTIKSVYKLMINAIVLNNHKDQIIMKIKINNEHLQLIKQELKRANSYNDELALSFDNTIQFSI